MAKRIAKTSEPIGRVEFGHTKFPGSMPYETQFDDVTPITQLSGYSDVTISEPLMDVRSDVPEAIQHGHRRIARQSDPEWTPSSRDTARKGPWRPKGADAGYRKRANKYLSNTDRGPGGSES